MLQNISQGLGTLRHDPLGQMLDTCECGIEPLGSIKCGEFVD